MSAKPDPTELILAVPKTAEMPRTDEHPSPLAYMIADQLICQINYIQTMNVSVPELAKWLDKYLQAHARTHRAALDAGRMDAELMRKLCLSLYAAGYRSGHHDTVEGIFHDDSRERDSEYLHGEAVTEIVNEYAIAARNQSADGAEG